MSVYGSNIEARKWRPRHPEKYVGDPNDIVARSSWEVKFLNWCDSRDDVLAYSNETVIIPYFDPVKNKQRRYFVDFWVKVKTKTGEIRKFLIEIKPDKFTKPPVQPKRKTKRYIEEQLQYVTNCAKWDAAYNACKNTDVEFLILTENELGIAKR